MAGFDLSTLLQIVGPAVAVYAAIRADMAAMQVRIAHLERDLYAKPSNPKGQA